jgi:hypothetical protein
MKKRFLTLLLVGIFCILGATQALAAGGMVVAEKLDAAERVLYGGVQKGSLIARADSMETDVYGSTTNYDVLYRIDHLYQYIAGLTPVTDGKAHTFILQLNGVDSRINKTQTSGPAKTRLEELERSLYNKNYPNDSLMNRLGRLVNTAYKSDSVPARYVMLPLNSVFEIEFPKAVTNKDVKAGVQIPIRAADNLYVNDVLVFPKGTQGTLVLTRNGGISWDTIIGKGARLDMSRSVLYASDGREIPVNMGEYAKRDAKAAPGAKTLNGIAFHNLPLTESTDSEIIIPAGAKTYVQMSKDSRINGIVFVK